MVDIDYNEMSDKELYKQLEQSDLVSKLETDPAWSMLKEAANRIVERAIREFALNPNLSNDASRIIELQTVIKKYRFGLFNEVEMLKSESEFIYQTAKARGLIGGLWDGLKDKIAAMR